MSFLIAVHVNEGIVLASDRRTTYTQTSNENGQQVVKIGVHTTNSTDKTFACPNGAGISTCGDASLLGKPITGYIQEMIRAGISPDTKISDIPQIIIDYFYSKPTVPNTNFIIAGYETVEDRKVQKLFKIRLADKNIEEIDTDSQGASWDGETFTLTRLIQNVVVIGNNGTCTPLPFEKILWEYFTLQDAIDFARFAVVTTINTMHFKNVVETVGGNVDILVITPEETKWIQREELR